MLYQHIAYVSCATKPLPAQELDDMLKDAREFNLKVNITGVLLCHHNTFFQFFEGSPEAVLEVYERIKNSKKHNNIFELVNEYANIAYFPDWSMGCCFIPQSDLQKLVHSNWKSKLPLVQMYAKESAGIKLLQEFWLNLAVEENMFH